MGRALRIGVAGLGIGSVLSLPEFAAHPRVEVVAAADLRTEALEAFRREFGGETFDSVEALCASPAVDVVYVSTPNYLHAEHAILAAEHRKHVLVEKPMALTLEECDAMIAAARRNRVQLVCGHSHSYDPPVRAMARMARDGSLGRLLMVATWNYTDLLYRPRAAWELDTRRGGGVVFIQAPHQVEIVRLVGGGLVRSVRAMTTWAGPDRPTEGSYTAYLEFEAGVPASLVYSGYAHFDSAELNDWTDATGFPRDPETHRRTRARAATNDEAARDAKRYGTGGASGYVERRRAAPPERQGLFGFTLASCERGDIRQTPDGLSVYGDGGIERVALPVAQSGRMRMLDELYAAVVEGRPPLHDGAWSKATLEVCLAILESARERREVLLQHQVAAADPGGEAI